MEKSGPNSILNQWRIFAFVGTVGMKSLYFFRPRGVLVRSIILFEACMCGDVGIRSLGFLWLRHY